MFLGFNLLFLFIFRVPLTFFIRHSFISRTSIFYSLIGIPCLVLFHAVFAGLVCEYLVSVCIRIIEFCFFSDFSFEYISLLVGVVAFAVVSVRAQRKKEVKFCRLCLYSISFCFCIA